MSEDNTNSPISGSTVSPVVSPLSISPVDGRLCPDPLIPHNYDEMEKLADQEYQERQKERESKLETRKSGLVTISNKIQFEQDVAEARDLIAQRVTPNKLMAHFKKDKRMSHDAAHKVCKAAYEEISKEIARDKPLRWARQIESYNFIFTLCLKSGDMKNAIRCLEDIDKLYHFEEEQENNNKNVQIEINFGSPDGEKKSNIIDIQ